MGHIFSFLGAVFASDVATELAVGVATCAIWGALTIAYHHYVPLLSSISDWVVGALYPARLTQDAFVFETKKIRGTLVRWLLRDQSLSGRHLGEFGRSGHTSTARIFQPKDGRHGRSEEALNVKPRMYLTYWPTKILAAHNLASGRVSLACRGVAGLLGRDYRILVPQASVPDGHPTIQPRVISYRHTMCAALLLCTVRGWSGAPISVLGAMLERAGGWQNADHGWKQDTTHSGSDLWSSVYAAKLLNIAIQTDAIPSEQRRLARGALEGTVDFLHSKWNDATWAYGASLPEENAVVIAIEVASVIAKLNRVFEGAVGDKLRSWLNSSNELSTEYLTTKDLVRNDVSAATLSAHMCYALYCLGEPVSVWKPTYDVAIRTVDSTLDSAAAAFLLDLTYELEQPHGQAGLVGNTICCQKNLMPGGTERGEVNGLSSKRM